MGRGGSKSASKPAKAHASSKARAAANGKVAGKPKPKPKAKPAKAKAKQAGEKPKRARSAYLHYSLDESVRAAVKAAHPDEKVSGLAKVLGAQWRGLSDEAKAPYQKRFEDERERLKAASAAA